MKRWLRHLWIVGCLMLPAIGILAQGENKDGYPTPELVVVPGSLQSELGCSGDWQPDCTNTALTYDEAADTWSGTFSIPAGSYEYKVALDGGWDRNYGANAEANGANIPLVLEADTDVTFVYDHKTGVISDSITGDVVVDANTEPAANIPQMVTIPGNLNPAMGCSAEWQPDCAEAGLEYNAAWDIWLKTFSIPAGSYEYKVAINGSWAENYGATADKDGANIALVLAEDTEITFFYDHKTNWVADTVRNTIVTGPGDYQTFVGCESNNDPACMASWLQDPEGDGVFNFSTTAIPAGDYSAQFAIGRTLDTVGEVQTFNVPSDGTNVSFVYDSGLNIMVVSVGGTTVTGSDIRALNAYWVTQDTLLWNMTPEDGMSYRLLYSANGNMDVSLFGLEGEFESVELTPADAISDAVIAKFPHLAGLQAFTVSDTSMVRDILRGQIAIAAYRGENLSAISGLQIPGVLDDLYTTDAPLGVNFDGDVPTLSVWAPTAQSVSFLLYADSNPRSDATELPMTRDDVTGVWSITGDAGWINQYYRYRVNVFVPSEMAIVTNDVTDPYSISLSQNSTRSQIINWADETLAPIGWDEVVKPVITNPEDITVYELHIRDFSVFDESVPEEYRGTYMAFAQMESNGMQHLAQLSEAGLTHLHLLPSFDIATINENRQRWFEADYSTFAGLAPDSEEQQAELNQFRDLDGFNWGYDPFHFLVPEGSYSTNPDGTARIVEYRQMVQSLNSIGLNVVQDVVFNHTNASGQGEKSVFDRIVPGYYHRLDESGIVTRSTCCANTATEHNMMRRLMVDTIVLMAIEYKVDGFRFDLMGHHMLADMIAVREALDALTIENSGVDGSRIYIYGEGWNFGEVANNARGINATQMNIAGTGIGVFNDRLRDAVRGGSPFGDREKQGLANGMVSNPNGLSEDNTSLARLFNFTDLTIVGLAGNLADYTFMGSSGEMVTGADIDYNGSPAGYTGDPQENIIYVDKHDNETLYDNNIYKAPEDTSMSDRVRMQVLGSSFVMYSQGVPFFQAGTELLRSKSLDRNSYNSGDWYNRLDFSMQSNNFGVGLPPSADNSGEWERMRPFLANTANVPTPQDIMDSNNRFMDMLRVRYSSPLFRLTTAEEVQAVVSFLNVGVEQQPGVIVMVLTDVNDIDPEFSQVIVVFNTTNTTIDFSDASLTGAYELHPALANGADELMKESAFAEGVFSVPMYSAAVFVSR
jgi:pullulanase